MSQALNATSAVFSLVATVFFIVGCAGYSTISDHTKNVAWITSKDNGLDIWINLQQIHYEVSGQSGHINWASSDCDSDYCNTCETDGKSAIGLLIISTVFGGIVTGLSGVLAGSHNVGTQVANFILSFISALFAIVGFGLFMGSCYEKLDQDFTADLKWGPGSIITLTGLVSMFIVTVLQLGSLIVGNKQ